MTGAGGLKIPTERQVQRSILAMCGRLFPDVWITHIPNGAHFAGTDCQRAMQMGALKGDGLKVGTPDLLCLWAKGGGALMEVKRAKGSKISPEQEALHDKLHALGWPVGIVHSADQAHAYLVASGAPCIGKLA